MPSPLHLRFVSLNGNVATFVYKDEPGRKKILSLRPGALMDAQRIPEGEDRHCKVLLDGEGFVFDLQVIKRFGE